MKIYAHKFFILIFIPIAQQLNAILNFFRIYTRKRFKRVRVRGGETKLVGNSIWIFASYHLFYDGTSKKKQHRGLFLIMNLLWQNSGTLSAGEAKLCTKAFAFGTSARRHTRIKRHGKAGSIEKKETKTEKNVVKLLCPS